MHYWLFILIYALGLEQISTQNEDYLVDTTALHDAMDVLRPVFANPSICKVICYLLRLQHLSDFCLVPEKAELLSLT